LHAKCFSGAGPFFGSVLVARGDFRFSLAVARLDSKALDSGARRRVSTAGWVSVGDWYRRFFLTAL
jgi:hypothetical protein